MRENLIQTSSIFSKNKYVDPQEETVLNDSQSTAESDFLDNRDETLDNYCRVLEFEANKDANISIRTFFPDSLYCIIYDKHVGAYFAAHIKKELIFEVPINDYKLVVVGQSIVVLAIRIKGDAIDGEYRYMILENEGYSMQDGFAMIDEAPYTVGFDGQLYATESTEVKPAKEDADGFSTYYYHEGNFITNNSTFLIFEGANDHKRLLLADETGTYIGYYLQMNSDASINLHGRSYEMIHRLTLPLSIVKDLETEQYKLLTCAKQVLVDLDSFYISDDLDIPIANGIAMLMEETNKGLILNVFTPNHQRIILEPKYKINDSSIGNGLYFAKDNVLLLANGSLLFTERVDSRTLKAKGKIIDLPISYLGEL